MAQKPKDPKQNNHQKAIVLFGGVQEMLPQELDELGLGEYIEAVEVPGVAPTWNPEAKGDFLLGRCVDKRAMIFDKGTKDEREAKVCVFQTAVPGGFRSVWLGADLEIKLHDPIGKVYQIYYEGDTTPNERSRRLNPMKTYRVMEIRPTARLAVPQDVPEE